MPGSPKPPLTASPKCVTMVSSLPLALQIGGSVSEPGVRPWFWVTIVVAFVMVVLILRGQWEWALVSLIAALVIHSLPYWRQSSRGR